uniref:BHLH domain-containing protein n=1 Tax=Strongyloides stercoralis TaxID=6248 RepID=A0A0K0E282_STRER
MSYNNFYSPNFQYPISSPEDFYPHQGEKKENNFYKDYPYYYQENDVPFNNINYTNVTNEGNYKTQARRDAANERERKRMKSLNKGFDELRQKLPSLSYKKRLSKVDTLKHAITYIQQLRKMLQSAEGNKKYAMVNIVDFQKLNKQKINNDNKKFEQHEDRMEEKHILNAKVWMPH